MRATSIAIALLTCVVGNAHAAVPTTLTVQGKLTDAFGTPLPAGFKLLTFKIFDAATLGNEVWPVVANEEDHFLNTNAEGLWSTAVGKDFPLTHNVFSDSARWLQVTVNDGVNPPVNMPRTKLSTGPYANRVATVDGAAGGTITSKVSIGPGHTNTGTDAFVAGANNSATGNHATVAGGLSNTVQGEYAAVGGGWTNTVTGAATTIAGGVGNSAAGSQTTIGGGGGNAASGNYSTVAGGTGNQATGHYGTVPGGQSNIAAGQASFAAGAYARALESASGSFVWSDGAGAAFEVGTPLSFNVEAANGLRTYANSTAYGGYFVNNSNGDGIRTYSNTSQGNNWAALYALNSGTGSGIWAQSSGGYAGYFVGPLYVSGVITKAGGGFKIDHPLDPENKYLYHSFVESPDMKNLYDGVATLDQNGEASIELPVWFAALNRDFRYQLTCIGGHSPVYIADKIAGNRFRIAGGKPGLEVSWQVTGTRQDAFANSNRIPVEEAKSGKEVGRYMHPTSFGKEIEKGIDYEGSKQ